MVGLLLAALLALPALAEPPTPSPVWKATTVTEFGGLNLLMDSTHIDGDAQQAVNVLTDNSYLEKRPGNVRLTTVLPGYQVQYVNNWYSPSGTLYLIAQASQTIYQTNFSGAPIALSTVAVGYNLTTVSAFSRLEFSDGFRPLFYWDGNSTGTVKDTLSGQVAPVCTFIDYKDARIWCANLPNGFSETGNTQNGGGSSTVLISSVGGDGYWAVPSNFNLVDSAANRFDFNPNDGDQITCLAKTPWGEFVGKRYSSYIVKGNGNLSYEPRLLDPKIGCLDNRSVQMVYGVLEWLAVDGVYAYDGSGPPRLITRDLDPLMQTVREATFSQGQWATQLYADWQTGTESTTTASLPPLPWDYTSSPGSIFPSSFTMLDSNANPALQTSGGVGFSSDTLVNIDTTTYPLSIGAAISMVSSSGTAVWASSFPAGNYTTTYTTWTVSGYLSASDHVMQNGNDTSGTQGAYLYLYTMANSSAPSPGSNGWNYGAWTFNWAGGNNASGGSTYGSGCSPGGIATTRAEFHFMADSPQAINSSWNGYGLMIYSPGSGPYTISLFKSLIGARTTLASYSFNAPGYGTIGVALSTISVTRSPSGVMGLTVNGVNAFSVQDNSPGIQKNTLAEVLLIGVPLPAASQVGRNALYSASLTGYAKTASILSRIYDTGQSSPLAGVLSSSYTLQGQPGETEIDFYLRSSTSPNNDMWSSWQASSNSVLASMPRRYWQHEEIFTSRVASATVQLQSVSLVGVTTGYYYSKVNYVGPLITSWLQFGVTENNPGTYGYAVRSSTNPNDLSSPLSGTAWVSQTASQNVNLGVSTPTYAQFRLDSTPLTSNTQGATAAEPITAVFLRWNQGADLPVASDTLERRYYLCVTISTTSTAPDTCIVRQKTGKWVQWSNGGTIGAMGLYNNNMVAADGGNTSRVWEIMQPNVYQDDGSPINSYWVSEDYTDGLIFNNKILHEMWVDATPIQGSSVTASYQFDKQQGYSDYQFTLDNGFGTNAESLNPLYQYGSINQFIPLQTGYQVGRYFRVKFSDNQINDYFRINAYMLYFEDQARMTP